MKDIVRAGTTDYTIDIFILDETATDGSGLIGLAYDDTGLLVYYRKGADGASTALTLASLANAQAAHTDGGFVEVDDTEQPGVYRLDLSDTMLADEGMLKIYIHSPGGAPVTVEIKVVERVAGLFIFQSGVFTPVAG